MVQHSKESALTPRQFELLLEGVERIEKDRQRTEARFAVLVAGRLGLRAGELVHLKEDWINWRDRRIDIPRQMDCHLGTDGGPCGYCVQAAEQMADIYDPDDADTMSRARERFINKHLPGGFDRGDELSVDDILHLRWHGKTEAAARKVPFGHNPRVELAIERFFELPDRDGWNLSKSALNRRLNKALRLADELDQDSTMPHGLRATAASLMAGQNVDSLTLKSVLGWADLQTAQHYLADSPDRAERALHRVRTV